MPPYSEATFQGEYCRELKIAKAQLLALGESVPADSYTWRPTANTRTFSAVLVHIATGNLMLLKMAGAGVDETVTRVYRDPIAAAARFEDPQEMLGIIRRNVALERDRTEKADVIELLKASFEATEASMLATTSVELDKTLPMFQGRADGFFFTDETTVRRLYLRLLVHTHEHMGQAIAYVRAMGAKVPWPDPLAQVDAAERAMEDKA